MATETVGPTCDHADAHWRRRGTGSLSAALEGRCWRLLQYVARDRPAARRAGDTAVGHRGGCVGQLQRSEEQTSELQSLLRISYAVFCLKNKNSRHYCGPTIHEHTKTQ